MLSGQVSTNNAAPNSILRQPRGFVSINGVQAPWKTFEVSNTRYGSANTFHVAIPANSLPQNLQLEFLLNQSPITVQINAGTTTLSNPSATTPSDLTTLILGDADDVSYDVRTQLLTLSGRDYISRFIENKVFQVSSTDTTSFFNSQTASQIVTYIATKRGLTPNVTDTSTQVGTYDTQYVKISAQITEWDLMVFLAREEGFDIFVSGMNLYFQPSQVTLNATPYKIAVTIPGYSTPGGIVTSSVNDISFARNLRIAKNIIVVVSTYNITNKTSYSSTATLKHSLGSTTSGQEVYPYTFPNLTQDQCTQKANALLHQISQHEMTTTIKMPADGLVTEITTLSITGTNTIFDQLYYVKNVTRRMDFGGGYVMDIEAKNWSPNTMSVAPGTPA